MRYFRLLCRPGWPILTQILQLLRPQRPPRVRRLDRFLLLFKARPRLRRSCLVKQRPALRRRGLAVLSRCLPHRGCRVGRGS